MCTKATQKPFMLAQRKSVSISMNQRTLLLQTNYDSHTLQIDMEPAQIKCYYNSTKTSANFRFSRISDDILHTTRMSL